MSQLSEHRFLELKATGDLPSPTGVALTVLEHLQHHGHTTEAITSTIQADPALAGRLIKLANSLSDPQGKNRPTVSLGETLSRVGPAVTKHITLGLSVLTTHHEGQCQGFDYQAFWSHSLAMGIATELLSEREQLFPKDEAFTVGLLSNIGRLALANVYPVQYTKILEQVKNKPVTELLAAEQKHLFTDHLDMAHAMLRDWGLPAVHYDAIHGMYELKRLKATNPRACSLAHYLNLASTLATLCLQGSHMDDQLHKLLQEKAGEAGIRLSELDDLLENTRNIWNDWSQLLEVPAHHEHPDSDQEQPIELTHDVVDLEQTQEIGLRILIADDDADSARLLKKQLTHAGHTVRTASSGKAALQIALEANPHLLITDWLMPEMDGLELCRSLRKTRLGQQMYIIVLTSLSEDGSIVKAFRAGADDYIEKPVKMDIVLARIRGGQRVYQLQQAIQHEQQENRRILSELAIANQHLEQAALTDPLTGVPNRRYATNRLEQEWATSVRILTPLSCILVDIDHFKKINDQYGHDVGDKVLCQVAQTMRSAARAGDEVCRIGGEEFLVICDNTSLNSAQATAERLRLAIENLRIQVDEIEHKVTISLGIASRQEEDLTVDDLLKAADRGVYAAKAQGRNRTCVETDRNQPVIGYKACSTRAPQPVEVADLA